MFTLVLTLYKCVYVQGPAVCGAVAPVPVAWRVLVGIL